MKNTRLPLVLLLAASSAHAAPDVQPPVAKTPAAAPVPAPPPRPAKAILADYLTALGGRAAFARHRSLYVKRRITVAGTGVGGDEERWATSAGKFLSVTTLPGVGSVKQGSSGDVRWSEDPINGLRRLAGAEDEQARIDAAWNGEVFPERYYPKITVVPAPAGAPAGVSLECLELAPRLARPVVACFDASTHLRVYQEGRQATAQGDVPFRTKLGDWRDVGGVKMPHREDTVAGPASVQADLVEAKFDLPIPPSRFRVPPAVLAKQPVKARVKPEPEPGARL